MRRHLAIPPMLVRGAKSKTGGAHSYILTSTAIENLLYEEYGRAGLCLKVFRAPLTGLDVFPWDPRVRGDVRLLLTSCTKAQNLFALRGKAPRVYDIALFNNTAWAQVVDFVGEDAEPPSTSLSNTDVLSEFRITSCWDMSRDNWINGWLVDFGAFYWKDEKRYIENMKERINKYASWGSKPLPYQSAFNLPAQRNMSHRVKMMQLDEIDFTGKTVLDLGCSLGLFCQDALQRGAKRAVGIERRVQIADIAYEVANWHGYWNTDFLSIKFSKKPSPSGRHEVEIIERLCGLASFDIVYALSIMQIGYHPWIVDMCNDVFYLEGHVPDREHTYRERLEADFSSVEYLGMTRDHGARPLFRCRR